MEQDLQAERSAVAIADIANQPSDVEREEVKDFKGTSVRSKTVARKRVIPRCKGVSRMQLRAWSPVQQEIATLRCLLCLFFRMKYFSDNWLYFWQCLFFK